MFGMNQSLEAIKVGRSFIKSVCDHAGCREAFCSKSAELEDVIPDQPLHFPVPNF